MEVTEAPQACNNRGRTRSRQVMEALHKRYHLQRWSGSCRSLNYPAEAAEEAAERPLPQGHGEAVPFQPRWRVRGPWPWPSPPNLGMRGRQVRMGKTLGIIRMSPKLEPLPVDTAIRASAPEASLGSCEQTRADGSSNLSFFSCPVEQQHQWGRGDDYHVTSSERRGRNTFGAG